MVLRRQAEATMAQIHRSFPAEAEAIAHWREVLPVALVLGGPRGGTSAFKSILAQHSQCLAMAGEHRLFFTLMGLNHPDAGSEAEAEDGIPSSETARLLIDFILTCAFHGPERACPDADETLRYALDWALRLPLQWSGHDIDPDRVVTIVTDAVARFRTTGVPDLNQLDGTVLAALVRAYPFVQPALYDGVGGKAPNWPEITRAGILPIVEITPFVVPRPRMLKRRDTPVSLLLLKASSDPFRLRTLRALFADRDVTILRLLRNPMASINGLLDGWNYPAFWQHDLSDLDDVPATLRGWCFDLFPDWRKAARSGDLRAIAAKQWSVPNRRLTLAEGHPAPNETWHRFRFELFQASPAQRAALMGQAAAALGFREQTAPGLAAPRYINATSAPRARRWQTDRPDLARLLDLPEILATAEEIGYDPEKLDDWL
jgi:hypothetical protein